MAALAAVNEKFNDAVENCGYAAGLSLGEYTALFFAGVINLKTACVVADAASAMQAAADTAPAAWSAFWDWNATGSSSYAESRLGVRFCEWRTCFAPGNIAVWGTKTACERIAKAAEAAGAMKTVRLAVRGSVSHADHAAGG